MPEHHKKSAGGAPDRRLAERAALGDRAALGALFERHRERLLQIVRARLGPELRGRLESGDVVQSAFVDAVRDYSAVAPRSEEFLPWIARVVERTLIDRARFFARTKRRGAARPLAESCAVPSPAPTPSVVAMKSEALERLERAIARLSPADSLFIKLSKKEGKTAPEIAKILGKSRDAAEKGVARAMARLAREIVKEKGGA